MKDLQLFIPSYIKKSMLILNTFSYIKSVKDLQLFIPSYIKKSILILLYEIRQLAIEYLNFKTLIIRYCMRVYKP